MRLKSSVIVIVAVVLALIAAGGGYYLIATPAQPAISCDNPLDGHKILRTNLSPTKFDGVTKYLLPSPLRNPNALFVAPDGSVWFGEQTIPGVGHIFPDNGTLVEYSWPFKYPTSANTAGECVPKTETWGITLWNGRVWATDSSGNQLVGLDPSTGNVQTVKVSGNFSFPYTITVSPSGSLWFTELYNGKIGSLDQSGKLQEYPLPEGPSSVPSEIVFANSTLSYYVDVGEAGVANGGVYAFNPQNFAAHRVAPGQKLNIPTSISLGGGGMWLAIHGASNLAFYNASQGAWAVYPTSTISYASTTLPYFVKSNGSLIWFNEHYGDKLARIDLRDLSLTEFSLSNPPANNGTNIGNALTFGLGNNRVWFAQWTANYVGYLNPSHKPPFSTSVVGNRNIQLSSGKSQTVEVSVQGHSGSNLSMKFSDSEQDSAQPNLIHFAADTTTIPSLQGSTIIKVVLTAARNVAPGQYTVLVTVSDGHESSSVYLNLAVS
jgi:virginiamycin B lyase